MTTLNHFNRRHFIPEFVNCRCVLRPYEGRVGRAEHAGAAGLGTKRQLGRG